MDLRTSLLIALTASTCAAAADANLTGPAVGYIYDGGARTIRPIIGIPGAAQTGAVLDICGEMERAAVSPEQDYVLAVCGAERQVRLLRLGDGASSPLERVPAAPHAIALSPRGTAAILQYRDEGAVVIVSGLPERPSLRSIAAEDLHNTARALAVSDDGAVACIATATGDLYVADEGGLRLAGLAGALDVRFRPGSRDAAIIAGSYFAMLSNNVVRVIAALGTQPRAIEFSRDGSRILVGTTTDIVALSLTGEVIAATATGCHLISLFRMNTDSVLRMECENDPGLRIVETAGDRLRVLFVPLLQE